MPNRESIHYFGAGPAALPTPVLTTAAANLLNFNNTGLGLMEHSHRSGSSTAIITEACSHLLGLLGADASTHTALFMQGGGTTQFAAVYYNLLSHWVAVQLANNGNDIAAVKTALRSARADYLVTGTWSDKAAKEAKRLAGGDLINVAADARQASPNGKFGDIPAEATWSLTDKQNAIYAYFCDNETVDGVEFPAFPERLKDGRFVVADMSSNILSRPVDIEHYAVIFAGAQKNVGGAGVTLVIVKSAILALQAPDEVMRELGLGVPPVMMQYPVLAKNNSLYNTLPIFDVFICREVMKGLVERGGLRVQAEVARRKAEKVYEALAEVEAYEVVPRKEVRSRMNICFRIRGGEEVEGRFVKGAEERGLLGLKGHRSVGGLRVSNYNSISEEGIEKLVAWIREFGKTLA